MQILIVSDAWRPQVNGVVRTLEAVSAELHAMGHTVGMITPDRFRSIPCPTYPEIRLAFARAKAVADIVDEMPPDAIHIATEGPLGLAARRLCMRRGLAFSTSFHTRFPEYIYARCRLPIGLGYAAVRWFHRPSRTIMVATESLRAELGRRGFANLAIWGRGVDTTLFRPGSKALFAGARPALLYVGRVAVEKNVEAFLRLKTPGSKYVIGDGPSLDRLRRAYPDVRFLGPMHGAELAAHYASADVFVFPSRTDTYGNVLLEALASGVPVAAYPVPGPIDVIGNDGVGALDHDLSAAVQRALAVSPAACRAFAEQRSWRESATQFLGNLAPVAG